MRQFLSIYTKLNNLEKYKFHLIFLFTVILILLEMLSLGLILPIIIVVINGDFELNFKQLDSFSKLDKDDQIIICLIALVFTYLIKNIFLALLSYFKKIFLKRKKIFL